eukprot:c8260_g1_i1 orf=25-315(+)
MKNANLVSQKTISHWSPHSLSQDHFCSESEHENFLTSTFLEKEHPELFQRPHLPAPFADHHRLAPLLGIISKALFYSTKNKSRRVHQHTHTHTPYS